MADTEILIWGVCLQK